MLAHIRESWTYGQAVGVENVQRETVMSTAWRVGCNGRACVETLPFRPRVETRQRSMKLRDVEIALAGRDGRVVEMTPYVTG